MSRVVITGAGAVSAAGNSVAEIMRSIETARKCTGEMRSFDTYRFPAKVGAEVRLEESGNSSGSAVDRKEVFFDMALSELFSSCSWLNRYGPAKRVMNIGAGMDYFDLSGYIASGEARNGNWKNFSKKSYTVAEALAGKYSIDGGCLVNVTACVASSQAVGLSFRMLKRDGGGRVIITGGFDSMLNHLHYMGFYMLGALSRWEGPPEEACRPFDRQRSGLVLGEGACVLAMQALEDAEPESIMAEVVGYSSTMDAYMVTDPDPEGTSMARAAEEAIAEAGISPDDIGCVHLHGTGTVKNELAEYKVMRHLFGERATEIPVYSMKGQVGHLIGACGAIELLGVIYSLQNQAVPVTVNFSEPDPEVPFKVIKDESLRMDIVHVLKLNAAFGGQNTALVLKRYQG